MSGGVECDPAEPGGEENPTNSVYVQAELLSLSPSAFPPNKNSRHHTSKSHATGGPEGVFSTLLIHSTLTGSPQGEDSRRNVCKIKRRFCLGGDNGS